MFEAFGFLHCRGAFTATEMADIIRAVEAGRAHGLDRTDGRELIVGNERLTALLLEDDRSGGAVAQLMMAMGEAAGCSPIPIRSGAPPRTAVRR